VSNERERIEHLLAEGKISAEEAERLRTAMNKSEVRAPVAPEPVAKPRLSRLAVASALGLPAAVTAGLLVYAFGLLILLVAEHADKDDVLALAAGLTGFAVLLAGAIAGIAALVAVRNAPDRLRGRGLAILGVLQLPVVAVLCTALLLLQTQADSEGIQAEPAMHRELDVQRQPDDVGTVQVAPVPVEIFELWQRLQAIMRSETPSPAAVLELMEPTWAEAVRGASSTEETEALNQGTLFGSDLPEEKADVAQLGKPDAVNLSDGSEWVELVIGHEGEVMRVPVIQINGRYYFARGPVQFEKRDGSP